jgi:hypothetical protein
MATRLVLQVSRQRTPWVMLHYVSLRLPRHDMHRAGPGHSAENRVKYHWTTTLTFTEMYIRSAIESATLTIIESLYAVAVRCVVTTIWIGHVTPTFAKQWNKWSLDVIAFYKDSSVVRQSYQRAHASTEDVSRVPQTRFS